jgi:predicted metal-dependent HD superfamily phosphohydrolase
VTNQDDVRKKFSTSTSWCHLAARAVATAFRDKGLTFVDGTVADVVFTDAGYKLHTTTHSWCKTKNGSILDVAPVGILSFSPLLYSRSSNVINTEWGHVQEKYWENSRVEAGIKKMLRQDRFKKAFPVYVSLLESARKRADRDSEENQRKKR